MQKTFCLLITGLPCSGKTTLGKRLYGNLSSNGIEVELFDGDRVRESISKDLDFSRSSRIENIVRVAKRARDLMDRGSSCILSMVAPYSEARLKAREIIGEELVEIYLDVSLKVCESRDVKGMYKRARSGEIKNFTGIDDIYEEPINPDIRIRTDILDVEDCVKQIEDLLARKFLMPKSVF